MTKPSPYEPVSALKKVPIVDNGEPLVDFMEACPDLIFDRPRFRYRRERLVRQSVAKMLCEANARLPKGHRLAVIEGWRAPHIQRRMYAAIEGWFRKRHPEWPESRLRRVVNQFSAPMDAKAPPPHSTGGAVDLLLARDDGTLLDHCSPYEETDPRGFPFRAKGLSESARRTRETLCDILLASGLTNYPCEYWHWSYGDQGWAYRSGHPQALYGPVEPQGWTPDPADMADDALEWIEEPVGSR